MFTWINLKSSKEASWNHRSPVRYLSWANGSSSRRAVQPGQPWSWLSTGRALGWTADDFEVAKCPSFQCFFPSIFLIVCRCYLIGCLGTENSMFFFFESTWRHDSWHDSIPLKKDRFSSRLRDEMRQETFDERASKAPHLTSTAEAVDCEARDACPRRSHSIIIRCCVVVSKVVIPTYRRWRSTQEVLFAEFDGSVFFLNLEKA